MNTISTYLNQARSNGAAFTGLRVLAAVASIAACASLAGCASDMHAASNASSWTAAGNNGGKVDRYAIARGAVTDSAVEVASGSTPASRAQ